MSTRNEFSTFDIGKTLGIPRARLQGWMRLNFIQPSVIANGPDTRSVFTRLDVYAVALFQNLIYRGFRREIAAGHVEYFVKNNTVDVDYLCFRYEVIGDGTIAGCPFFLTKKVGKSLKINLPTATPDNTQSSIVSSHILGNNEDWDDFFCINIKRLKKKTDQLLLTLE